jgi:hypothetical protein
MVEDIWRCAFLEFHIYVYGMPLTGAYLRVLSVELIALLVVGSNYLL